MLILISDSFGASLPERLSEFGEVTTDKNRLPEAEVIIVRSKTKCTREYMDFAANLKLIIRGGVGLDNVDVKYAEQKGIMVHNTPQASAIAVSELAFSLMLSASNKLFDAQEALRQGKWLKNEIKRQELFGKTLCLVGMGNVATEVAKRAQIFGMKVCATRKTGAFSPHACVLPNMELALKNADYVSLHVPLNNETEEIINRDTIELMKDGAILINTCRAAIVEPYAVRQALEQGKLSAYATDVFPSDPPEEDYPLLSAPNVYMTPHIGASTDENMQRIGDEIYRICQNIFL